MMKNSILLLIFALLSFVLAQNQVLIHNTDLRYHPLPYEKMYVGSQNYVSYDPSEYTDNDTVSIFFEEYRNITLAYGLATKGNYSFIVPEGALTPPGHNASNILAVFRHNLHLWKVLDFPVVVLNLPSNETTTVA